MLPGAGFGLGRVLMPLTRTLSGEPQRWDRVLSRRPAWIGRVCAAGFVLAPVVGALAEGCFWLRGRWTYRP
ncbi:hypothetical protein [Nonomuraea sp. KM90]|uniref:hypothetical protein n=1 Tax=Nonomuraea sp. KM90 TaxID=3457428 RepID=UPI003FCE2B5C